MRQLLHTKDGRVARARDTAVHVSMAVAVFATVYLPGSSVLANLILHAIAYHNGSHTGRADAALQGGDANGDTTIIQSFQNVTSDLMTPALAGGSFLLLVSGIMFMWGSVQRNHHGLMMAKMVVVGMILIAAAVPIAN